jgi:hypothetical protein
VTQITKLCKGHSSGKCVDYACSQLGVFGCDDFNEIQQVHQIVCKPSVDPDCMKSVCSKLGTFGCDDMDELHEVSNSCAGF